MLAFQSIVDATVSTPALVKHLFAQLPDAGHELVLFDVNRQVGMDPLFVTDPRTVLEPMLARIDRSFDLSIVTNRNDETSDVVIWRHQAGSEDTELTESDLLWPTGVFSLSHVALPFAPDDPLYGGPRAGDSPGIQLGNVDARGERGVLRVSGNDFNRLRWNPFFARRSSLPP